MKLNRKMVLVLSLLLSVALATGSTLAYLSDTDADVNVMTLGNVHIDQIEYERVVDENGNWVSTGETDKYGYTPDQVKEFTQGKPLYPAVFADGVIKWDDRNGSENPTGAGSHQQSWGQVDAPGSNQLFDGSVKNVQDKFVFVKNTGASDAYVRTWIALEQGSVAADDFKDIIMTNTNATHWDWEVVATDAVIDGGEYYILLATYNGPASNPTGILAPGAVTYPSLLQVYMRPEATNEDVEAIDGNKNGTYDILVVSQAVQAAGFSDAKTALNAGFKAPSADSHPWLDANGVTDEEGDQEPDGEHVIPNMVDTQEELKDALTKGGKILLGADITLDETMLVPEGVTVELDLNGKKLTGTTHKDDGAVLKNKGTMTLVNGIVTSSADNGGSAVVNNGKMVVENATLNGAPNADGNWPSYAVNNTGDLTLKDVKVTAFHGGICSYGANAVVTLNKSELDMAGIPGFTSHGMYTYNGGKMIVNGGTYANKAEDQNATGASVINGAIEVNNGTFSGRIEAYYATPVLKGGNYSVAPNAGFIADGYAATQNADGTYTVAAK